MISQEKAKNLMILLPELARMITIFGVVLKHSTQLATILATDDKLLNQEEINEIQGDITTWLSEMASYLSHNHADPNRDVEIHLLAYLNDHEKKVKNTTSQFRWLRGTNKLRDFDDLRESLE
jgi:hypothetical protein